MAHTPEMNDALQMGLIFMGALSFSQQTKRY
jgi:hypothetical protein